MTRSVRTLAVVPLAAVLLAGCGATDFFRSEEIPLPGERKPVRQVSALAEPATGDAVPSGLRVSLPAAVPNADWPQLNGSAERNIGHVSAAASLSRVWSADVGSGSQGAIVSTPVAAGGTVYALDTGATLTAIDGASGKSVWRVDLTPDNEYAVDGFGGGLAVEGGTLYATSGFGRLHAFNAASGEERWSATLRAPSRAAPAVIGGRVFALTRDNRIYAFDAQTGEALWDRQGLEQTAGALGGGAPAATGDVVVAPYSSGELTAYVAASGRPIWDEELTGLRGLGGLAVLNDVSGDPVISNGTVYAASQSGRLVAVNLADGDRLWTRNVGGNHPPLLAGNTLFFVSGSGQLLALAADTGEVIWEVPLGAFEDPADRDDAIVWAGPILAGGRLLLVSNTERMISVDPTDGSVLGEIELPDGASAAPIVANGTVYVLTDNATLVAYR